MKKKLRIRIGKCYISRSLMPGQTDFYTTIRSGMKKIKTKIMDGPSPDFGQTFDLEIQTNILKVKVKDAGGASCLGGCTPFNTVLGEADVDISQCVTNMEKIQGFYSLKYGTNSPAGKIYLSIVPLQG